MRIPTSPNSLPKKTNSRNGLHPNLSNKEPSKEWKQIKNRKYLNRASVGGAAIQATGTVEFEDGLRTGVLLEDCWCPYVATLPLMSDMERLLRPTWTQEICPIYRIHVISTPIWNRTPSFKNLNTTPVKNPDLGHELVKIGSNCSQI